MNHCISSCIVFDISNIEVTISKAEFDASYTEFDASYTEFDASYTIIYKTNQPKPKSERSLIQTIIKLHKFLCFQATTLLVVTLILSSLCKCYDVLIYVSFGTFISILFMGCYGLLLKFNVLASREFNEKYNNTIFCLWKKYIPCTEISFFTFMAVFTILWHMFFGFLALYYVKNFIKNSISTKYSYIVGYLLIVLFCAINYNSAFKLYNNSLKCSVNEFNNGVILDLFVIGGLIYYFETIKVSI